MGTHSSILAWESPWTEVPGGLQSMGSQRVGYDLEIKPPSTITYTHINVYIYFCEYIRLQYTHVCLHTHIYTHVCVCIFTHTDTHMIFQGPNANRE